MILSSGHQVTPIEGVEREKRVRHFQGYTEEVRVNPDGWILPARFKDIANRLYNFEYKNTDVVIMSWLKCGSTWTEEIVWNMRNNPNLDLRQADVDVSLRAFFIDWDFSLPIPKAGDPPADNIFVQAFMEQCPNKDPKEGLVLQMAEVAPGPRIIKTHMPFSFMAPSLLDTAKVVYVARNPKDMIASFYHFSRWSKTLDYVGSFDELVQYFVDDEVVYGPYWRNLKEAWEKRTHPNLHIMYYEDMKAKPLEEFRKLSKFLDANLTERQLEGMVKYTSFSEMKERDKNVKYMKVSSNPDIEEREGGFFWKGETGYWKDKLTPDLEAKVDKWIQKNFSFGIDFKYEV